MSPFTYCANSPINRTDPSGLCDLSGLGNKILNGFGNAIIGGLATGWTLALGGFALGAIALGGLSGLGLGGALAEEAAATDAEAAATDSEAAAGGRGFCFVSGTPIDTNHGQKPIEKIQVGDEVWATDTQSHKSDYYRVVRTFVHSTNTLEKVEVSNGDKIECTPTHPFWVEGRGWTEAKSLKSGDHLLQSDGQHPTVTNIYCGPTPLTNVYNFEVERFHSYYVGRLGLLVHNDCMVGGENAAEGLTGAEREAIQAISNKYGTTIDVVGSRAAGTGRNIETSLPVGKGANFRSDIDFRIDVSHPQVDDLISELKGVGNGAGSASTRYSTTTRATTPPVIRFTPNQ